MAPPFRRDALRAPLALLGATIARGSEAWAAPPVPVPKDGVSDVEFNGPFPDWLNGVTHFKADPTGHTDSAPAIQAMLDAIATDNNLIGDPQVGPRDQIFNSLVAYLPPGTYSIRSTLVMANADLSVDASFEDKSFRCAPGTVTLRWDGPPGGTMLWMNGCHSSVISGITFDGNDGRARIGVRFERDPRLQLTSQSFNRLEDVVIKDCKYNVFNTQGTAPGSNRATDSEFAFVRCHFLNASSRGICNTGFQSFDFWISQCYFEGNFIAVSNGDSGDADTYPYDDGNYLVNSRGSFSVVDSIFNGSKFLDIQHWGGHPTSILRNFSVNSQRFCQLRGAFFEVNGNTIVDAGATDTIQFSTLDRGNLDPRTILTPAGRMRSIAMANAIRSRPGAQGPVIREIFDAKLDAFTLGLGGGDPYAGGSLRFWQQGKPLFLAYANRFSVDYAEVIATDPTYDNTILSNNRTGQAIDGAMPLRAPFARQVARPTFVMGAGNRTPQQTIDAAKAHADAHPGSCPVVYMPRRAYRDFYEVSEPVVVPANTKMSIQGTGPLSFLTWSGDPDDTRPYWLFRGPSRVTIKDCGLGQSGGNGGKRGVVGVFDRCDQVGARALGDNGTGYPSTLGTANLRLELVQCSLQSNIDDNAPMRFTCSAASGDGYTLMEACTIDSDRPDGILSVEDGGRLFTRQIWFESDVQDQINIVTVGHGGAARPGWFSMETSRWVCRNQSPTRGGENWRFVQGTSTDFNGQLVYLCSDYLGSTRLAGDCSRTDFFNMGGTTVIEDGDPAPRTMYRNHGPLSRLEQFQIKDTTPVGITGTLPANWQALLDTLIATRPTIFITDLAAGVTDVRMCRVFADLRFIPGAYA